MNKTFCQINIRIRKINDFFVAAFEQVQYFTCLNFPDWKSIGFTYLAQPKRARQSNNKRPNSELRYTIYYKQ